jgi:hypothetical protein
MHAIKRTTQSMSAPQVICVAVMRTTDSVASRSCQLFALRRALQNGFVQNTS